MKYKRKILWHCGRKGDSLDDVTKELAEIQAALDTGIASYTLQYSVKCKQNLFRTIED